MGNDPPKNVVITYQVISKQGEITVAKEDLEGKYKYPKMPNKKTEVLDEYNKFLSEVILNPMDKMFLEQLTLKHKWNLIQRHRMLKSNLLDLYNNVSQTDEKAEVIKLVDECLTKPSRPALENLQRKLEAATDDEWGDFFVYRR